MSTMFNRFRQMRISRQLSFTAGASIILFTITLTAITSTLISRQLRDNAVTDARLQTEQFAERSIFAFLVDDLTVAEDSIGSITAFPNIDDARLIRADGEALARYNKGNAINDTDNPIRHLTDIRESSDYWIVAAPVLSSPERSNIDGDPANAEYLGSVVLAFSKSPVRETIRTIWIINGLAGLAAAGIFLALLSFQMRVLTDPLRSLSSTMSNGGRDAPRERARLLGSKEIQEIAAIYNQLMDEIEKSQAALKSEVAIRTQELKTARDAAFAANRQKSEIMAAVTHEMKTPLQAIIGYAQLTLEELEFAVEDDAAQRSREQLSNILGRAHELLNRITQMLDLARAEAGKFDLNLVETDISALLHDAQKSILPLATERNNKFTAEIDCPATVLIDRDKFQQIALNLMTNACKFTHKGEIHLKCKGRPDQLILEVEDTGVGIAEKDLNSVFEPFRQVDMSASRAFGGTGLGLAVSREFAKLMGGEIVVSSELEVGSTFTVNLPLPIQPSTGAAE
ncbi:sensor histidine kinase [Hyphococcus sp.]|uniref:sensor histidine kinase n=1 Tax=Hyphococcus sp. TaxID=2038636 RepID=UPI0035C7289F